LIVNELENNCSVNLKISTKQIYIINLNLVYLADQFGHPVEMNTKFLGYSSFGNMLEDVSERGDIVGLD
jgi:hypothetical protein